MQARRVQRKAQEHPELDLEPQRAALGMLRSTKHRFGCPEAREGLQGTAGVAAGGPVSASVRLGGFPRGSKRKAEAGVDKENAGKMVMVELFINGLYRMVTPGTCRCSCLPPRLHACSLLQHARHCGGPMFPALPAPIACVPCPAGTLEVLVDDNLQPDAAGPGPSSVGGWDRLGSFEQTRSVLI